MRVERLTPEKTEEFVLYCKNWRAEIDDSFLYDEDLRDFTPDAENPTCIVTSSEGKVVATYSLIIDEYHRRGRRARFRIFHSEIEDVQCYRMLMRAVLHDAAGLDKVFVFVPTENKKLMEFVEQLGFTVERYSCLLIREDLPLPSPGLPEDYMIRAFRPGIDEDTWCEVRNESFARLKGNDTEITAAMVTKMLAAEEHIEGGLMILWHGQKAVGVVRGAADIHEGSPIYNIGPLAVIPAYQGRGLGRVLLRASLQLAKEKAYKRAILCVNAENEKAKALYIQEGFSQVESVVCYEYKVQNDASCYQHSAKI